MKFHNICGFVCVNYLLGRSSVAPKALVHGRCSQREKHPLTVPMG